MTRTERELGSVTRTEQLLRQATPWMAAENCASDESPSCLPGLPHCPANVLTSPAMHQHLSDFNLPAMLSRRSQGFTKGDVRHSRQRVRNTSPLLHAVIAVLYCILQCYPE